MAIPEAGTGAIRYHQGWHSRRSRASSFTDVADELLQRTARRGCYDPWSEDAGRNGRTAWRRHDSALNNRALCVVVCLPGG